MRTIKEKIVTKKVVQGYKTSVSELTIQLFPVSFYRILNKNLLVWRGEEWIAEWDGICKWRTFILKQKNF